MRGMTEREAWEAAMRAVEVGREGLFPALPPPPLHSRVFITDKQRMEIELRLWGMFA